MFGFILSESFLCLASLVVTQSFNRSLLGHNRHDLSLYQDTGFSRRAVMMIGIRILPWSGRRDAWLPDRLGCGRRCEVVFNNYPSRLSIQMDDFVYMVTLIDAFHCFPGYHADRARRASAAAKTHR